jgi:hypothetical protein
MAKQASSRGSGVYGMAEVFLSYAAPDRTIASRLADDLKLSNLDVWYDQKLMAGENWRNVIERRLKDATAVIVLLSPDSLRSEWVTMEWQSAIARSARVLPVLIRGASFSDLPAPLADIHTIDLSSDYDRGLRMLARTIGSLNSSSEPAVADAINMKQIVDDAAKQVMKLLSMQAAEAAIPSSDDLDSELVFVICAFTSDMEPIFDAIAAAAASVGLRAERVKDVQGDYRITDRMLSMIRKARLIVADLTHERPNVYFELGYARGIGKTVITILRAGAAVHFDVQDWPYINYIDSRPLEAQLKKRFERELQGTPSPS